MKTRFVSAGTAVLFLALASGANADIVTSIGDTTSGFVNGSHLGTATVLGALTGPAPFNAICGSDITSNCSTNWTFHYSVAAGQTITGATLTLGIWDIDSAGAGNQVASYKLGGGDDLTAALNAVAEGLNGGTGSPSGEYDVLSISIPSTSFALLQGGTAGISLALQSGLGVLGATPFNGAGLVFSTLDLQTTSTPTTVPEPTSVALLFTAMGALAVARARRKRI